MFQSPPTSKRTCPNGRSLLSVPSPRHCFNMLQPHEGDGNTGHHRPQSRAKGIILMDERSNEFQCLGHDRHILPLDPSTLQQLRAFGSHKKHIKSPYFVNGELTIKIRCRMVAFGSSGPVTTCRIRVLLLAIQVSTTLEKFFGLPNENIILRENCEIRCL